MAVALHSLTFDKSLTDASSYTTASISPTAGRLVLIAIGQRQASGTPAIPTVTGCGLTWEVVHTYRSVNSSGNRRLTIFRAFSFTTPTPGTLVINFGGNTQSHCGWSVSEFSGVKQGSNGASAIQQSVENEVASATSLTITLSAFAKASNATLGYFLHLSSNGGVALTPGSGFASSGHDQNIGFGENETWMLEEFKATNDTSVDESSGTSNVHLGIALELIAQDADTGPVDSDIVIEWDLDNDGDFDEDEEDITAYVMSAETFAGRDWPSQLTGKAGPGKFKALLNNDDNRFSYFNQSSPLNTSPFTLKTGRKLRVRIAGATYTEPTIIAKDTFTRDNTILGTESIVTDSLGSTEIGSFSWTSVGSEFFHIYNNRLVLVSGDNDCLSYIDVGVADYYAEVRILNYTYLQKGEISISGANSGIAYRYVDANNYSTFRVELDSDLGIFGIYDVVGGIETLQSSVEIRPTSDMRIGVWVVGTSVKCYIDGVLVLEGTNSNTSSELVGIFSSWLISPISEVLDTFVVYDSIITESNDGVIWTGDVSFIQDNVTPGPIKTAHLEGEGWLSKLSTMTNESIIDIYGKETGLLMGSVLDKAMPGVLQGQIDIGTVVTGPYVVPNSSVLEIARNIEETEFGFLYELPEGVISFRDRNERIGSVSIEEFSDDSSKSLHYHKISPFNWRREIFNRIQASISPYEVGIEGILYVFDTEIEPPPPGSAISIQPVSDDVVISWTAVDFTFAGGSGSASYSFNQNTGLLIIDYMSVNITNIDFYGLPFTEESLQTFQFEDSDSQEDHNSIRTYKNAASLFANAQDAQDYADLVLGLYADDRPIVSISFYASKGTAYREQAYSRRIGDRITIEADNNAGMGIHQDFYIESINHRWSYGNTLWETTWACSPAPGYFILDVSELDGPDVLG